MDTVQLVRSMRHVLLVSEIFPPAIGGSGALLDNVYSRNGGAG
jgi:hypothetical protein